MESGDLVHNFGGYTVLCPKCKGRVTLLSFGGPAKGKCETCKLALAIEMNPGPQPTATWLPLTDVYVALQVPTPSASQLQGLRKLVPELGRMSMMDVRRTLSGKTEYHLGVFLKSEANGWVQRMKECGLEYRTCLQSLITTQPPRILEEARLRRRDEDRPE